QAQPGIEVEPQLDVLADDPAQHGAELGNDLVEVEQAGLQDLLPAEGQELPGQGRGAMRRAVDLQQIEPPGIPDLQVTQQQLAVADNGGQKVVEIVRDPAGELA